MRLYRLWFIIIGMLLPIVTYGEENQTTPPPALWPPSPTGDNVKVIPDLLIRTLVQSAANETICDVLVDKGDVSDRSECGDMIEQRRGTIRWAAGAKPLNCGYSCIKRPVLKATEELDVPNFNFVQIEGTLKFELDVPVFSDRYLNTQIFLDFICREDGGFVRVNVGKPNISAPSFIEQLLPEQLINYIDAQIREELPSSDSGVAHFLGKCGSIGVAQNNSGIPGDDGVIWKSPSKKRVIAAAPQMEGVSLTIKSISRNANSAIDGNDGFYFIVETSLGSKRIPESGTLSINPGQTMDFSSEDIKITGVPPEHEKLQVLVADNYGSAAWSQFKKTERFGKGERVIQPGIKVWYPPQQPATKPTSRIERQWEVKYEINYRAPQISTNPN